MNQYQRWLPVALLFFIACSSCTVVSPGERGVRVTLGNMSQEVLTPGIVFHLPILTRVWTVSVQQATQRVDAPCFSSDLQQVDIKVQVLYRIPEESTIPILRDYAGNAFDALIAPRVQEALKEATALKTAADIVKTREEVKLAALSAAQRKIGSLLELRDLVIENVDLSDQLEQAIEAKMVQQQEAEKAQFRMQQAEVDAKTKVLAAQAEAEAISITGKALQSNPALVQLRAVEKWNGVAPQILGGEALNLLVSPTSPH